MRLEMPIKMVQTNLFYISNFLEKRFFKNIFSSNGHIKAIRTDGALDPHRKTTIIHKNNNNYMDGGCNINIINVPFL